MNGVKQAKKILKLTLPVEKVGGQVVRIFVVRIEEQRMDVRCKIGKLDLCP